MIAELKFINGTYDPHRFPVAIFQEDHSALPGEAPIAWRVIEQCGYQWWHPFTFSMGLSCGLRDPFGNQSSRIDAPPGSRLRITTAPGGRPMLNLRSVSGGGPIEVTNESSQAINSVELFRDQRLLTSRHAIAPGQQLAFDFRESVHMVPAYRAKAGQAIDQRDFCGVPAEFSLEGVRRAEIIMTGGGPGGSAKPLTLAMRNIRR